VVTARQLILHKAENDYSDDKQLIVDAYC